MLQKRILHLDLVESTAKDKAAKAEAAKAEAVKVEAVEFDLTKGQRDWADNGKPSGCMSVSLRKPVGRSQPP